MKKKKVSFHQDDTSEHKSMKTMEKYTKLHFQLLPQQFYLPDLTHSDFNLFADLKKTLVGMKR